MRRLHTLILLAGLAFAAFLIHRIGINELWREFTRLGWGLVPLVLSEGVAELFHAISWRYCLSAPHRSIPLPRLFRIGMAGYAISYLTPTASLGGDVTKAGLLALHHKGPEAVSAVLIGKLSFALAHLILVVVGSIVILPRISLPHALWAALCAGGMLITFGILVFLWIQKHGKLGTFARWMAARNIGGEIVRNAARHISNIDATLKSFYREQPWGLAISVAWHLLGYGAGILQIFYFMKLLAPNPSFSFAVQVWFVGMWFDLLAFAVPMNLGILEASRIVAFRAVAYSPVFGITYAIVVRLAQLFWSAVGLAGYASLISRKSPADGSTQPFRTAWPARGTKV